MLKEILNSWDIHPRMWAMSPVGFWVIWITITVAAAIGAAWAVRQASAPKTQRAREGSINLTPARQAATRGAVAVLILLAIFLVFYSAIILLWEDFVAGDNELFTQFTLVGHNIPPQIWGGDWGRFFPLALQEFNVTRHFTNTSFGYYLIPFAQILIFTCILLAVDDELGVVARAALVSVVLLTPSVWISFSELIIGERDVLFFLACLMLSVKRFEQTKSIMWAVAATICAQVMIYCKETAFLLLLGFAAGRLVLRCRNARHAGWDYDRLWDKEARLDLCLAFLAMLFLLYYLALMGFHSTRYADELREPRAEIFFAYLTGDLLAWLFVAVVLSRIYMILRHRTAPALLWDGLAFGGLGCFLAYHYLGIFSSYYLAPVDLIAVLYVGRFVILSWKRMRSWSKATALVLAFTVLLQDVSFSAVAGFEQKNSVKGKVEIARVIEAQYRRNAGSAIRLFFPFALPYRIVEFAAYLNFKGVPVEGAVGKAAGPNSVTLATRAVAKDGFCAEEWTIVCHALSRPDPDDLVVVLPEDEASFAETSVYRERGELLFSYEPRLPIPQWLYSCIHPLKTLPDRWMYAAVTIWK